MNNNINIEDFFKDSFEGYKVEPSNIVWKGINKKLWTNQIGDFFKFSLEGFKIEPSAGLWGNIARKLWFYNFLRYNAASFNIYYLGLAISIVTVTLYTINSESKKNNFDTFYTSVETAQNKTSIIQNEELITSDIKSLNNPKEINKIESIKPIKNNTNIQNIDNKVHNKLTLQNKKHNIVTNKKIEANNNHQTFFKDQVLNDKKENNNQNFVASNNNENNGQYATNTLFGEQKLLLSSIQPKIGLLPFTKTTLNMIPDTLGVNIYGGAILLERVHWSVDAWWSPISNQTLFDTKFSENKNYIELLKTETNNEFTYKNFGADLNYSYKNWFFQIGLSYMNFGQKLNVPSTVIDIQPRSFYNYSQQNILHSDTVWFVDLDSLLHSGDTVMIPGIINQHWVVQNDSSLVTTYDSLKTTTHKTVSNKYTYFEIPIMAGYEIQRNKFSFTIKGGIATGFLINTNGKNISKSGIDSYELKSESAYVIPNFTLLFGIGINYHLNNKIAIFGEPYLRKNINSVFKNGYLISQKFQSVGIKFGLRYTFK